MRNPDVTKGHSNRLWSRSRRWNRKFTSHLALVTCRMVDLPYGLLLADSSPPRYKSFGSPESWLGGSDFHFGWFDCETSKDTWLTYHSWGEPITAPITGSFHWCIVNIVGVHIVLCDGGSVSDRGHRRSSSGIRNAIHRRCGYRCCKYNNTHYSRGQFFH